MERELYKMRKFNSIFMILPEHLILRTLTVIFSGSWNSSYNSDAGGGHGCYQRGKSVNKSIDFG